MCGVIWVVRACRQKDGCSVSEIAVDSSILWEGEDRGGSCLG